MDTIYALATEKEKDKEREREREKEKEREKDKEKEREMEMEAALYTNCLLLGLDASILGQGGVLRLGLFRHSNPRMGENLLYFLFCALRGPAQSAKDFAGVWPIFDAGQSRDFRKIVQNLINELEAQGALPRGNSRVSSLATCCGQRFVELLWQLSVHTLWEVHKRSFPGDVSANFLPVPLAEIATQTNHASALLTVTKARIAIERRQFVNGAMAAVRKQTLWSRLAHDMTADFRALCAEEAYLHQELEKLQEPKHYGENQVMESSLRTQKSLSVSRASQHWESLMRETVRHERLVSGPIEDLLSRREHRYRVSGSVLKAAMDSFSSTTSEKSSGFSRGFHGEPDTVSTVPEGNEDNHIRSDEQAVKGSLPLDVAEIVRRWTHSLQRIHKQSIILARSNDGTYPDLMKDTSDDGDNSHAQALCATVTEHKQYMSNIQLLINQVRECMPVMEASVSTMRKQLNQTSPHRISVAISSPLSGSLPASRDAPTRIKPWASCLKLVPPSPALKLPTNFSSVPVNPLNVQEAEKRHDSITLLRQEIHHAVLSRSNSLSEAIKPDIAECGIEHFFTPIEPFTKQDLEQTSPHSNESNQSLRPSQEYHRYGAKSSLETTRFHGEEHSLQEADVSKRQARTYKSTNKCLNYDGFSSCEGSLPGCGVENTIASPERKTNKLTCSLSPPLLTELSSSSDDLLGHEDFELADVALEGAWFNSGV